VGSDGPCEIDPPDPACSIECNGNDALCPSGFYCSPSNTCNADCTQGGNECGSGNTCDPTGHCVADTGGPDGGGDDDSSCPSVTVTPMPRTPTVQLLVDRSGSMNDPFGTTSRWNAVRTALTGTNGVVTTLQDRVIFGASLYSHTIGQGTCPTVVSTPTRMLNNRSAITTLLQNGLLTDTPTGESIDRVVADFVTTPAAPNSPPIILLATDGLPDRCAMPDGDALSQQMSIDAAARAYAAGIRTYILSVGNDVGDAHLQKVANAGAGLDPNTGMAPFYKANDPAQLSAALSAIITGILSCEFDLSGTVDVSRADEGVVTLNGSPLIYGTDWELADDNTIRILGASCDTLKAGGGTLQATFACGIIIE
jgi:hypothetical protein